MLFVLEDCVCECLTGLRCILLKGVTLSDYVYTRKVLIDLAALASLVLSVHVVNLLGDLRGLGPVQGASHRLWAMHSRTLVAELVLNDVDWVVSPVAAAVRIVGRILVYRGNLRPRLLMPRIAIVHNHHILSLTALPTATEQVLVRDTTHDRWIMLGSCQLRVGHFIALATTPINRVFFLLKHLLVHLKRALVKNSGVGIPRIHQDQAPFLAIRQSIAYRACLEGSA